MSKEYTGRVPSESRTKELAQHKVPLVKDFNNPSKQGSWIKETPLHKPVRFGKYKGKQLQAVMRLDFPWIITQVRNRTLILSEQGRKFFDIIYDQWGEESEYRLEQADDRGRQLRR